METILFEVQINNKQEYRIRPLNNPNTAIYSNGPDKQRPLTLIGDIDLRAGVMKRLQDTLMSGGGYKRVSSFIKLSWADHKLWLGQENLLFYL